MTGVLVALCLVGFAMVNIVFEITDHFANGRYADHASASTIMNWLVVFLEVVGATVALLSVATEPRLASKSVLTVLLWGAFAILTVYTLGSLVEAIGMVLDLTGTADQIDLASTGYLLFLLLASVGYGVLAISYSRRHHMQAACDPRRAGRASDARPSTRARPVSADLSRASCLRHNRAWPAFHAAGRVSPDPLSRRGQISQVLDKHAAQANVRSRRERK
ncbi:hypothetical protein [Streptomyces werraensis]|uniref:hypothetical protein n=1 Tax=Streptomyces werraensis TaxID=68284 RepID=UPI00382899F9